MARKSLRPQLNQIRAWLRQGRTDAWIAHQLEIPAAQLRDFIDKNGLSDESEDPNAELDLRDEIEAEIEAELDAIPEETDEPEEEGATDEDAGDGGGQDDEAGTGRRRRRRRGGRGGRGRGRRGKGPLEATFDHGKDEGYGLWLDPAVKDNAAYKEHWAGHRALKVTIEPERIVLERVDE